VRRAAAEIGEHGPARGVERRLNSLAWVTAPAAVASGLAITGSGLLRKRPMAEVVGSGVGLAVAAVPEGLTVLATLSQLAAARRLSELGALVRDPRALEALGRVDVLCADKTGTLTEGRIRLSRVSDGTRDGDLDHLDDDLCRVLAIARRASPERRHGEKLPHMTDQALVDGARRAEVASEFGLRGWHRLEDLPFEPSRGYYAALSAHEGGRLLSVKGAPEALLPACTHRLEGGQRAALSDDDRHGLLREGIRLARQGLRVLAVAERDANGEDRLEPHDVSGLTFCGFVGLSDPVHPSAREAMERVRRAGVRPIMLTGDHPSTANAIAAELGLLGNNGVITGPELDELDDDALAEKLPEISVCARTTPAHKVRIIRALQARGRVVAMTGDGANDSPAIQLADAGIAIGSHAAAAAREAADLVVTDARIETIVDAILEGRALWPAVRDAVSVLVGGNLGEIAFTLAGGVVTGSSPLNARQLLLVNLITDTLPALALALKPPRRKDAE
jgi:cation-transporting P-type ATPase I